MQRLSVRTVPLRNSWRCSIYEERVPSRASVLISKRIEHGAMIQAFVETAAEIRRTIKMHGAELSKNEMMTR